LRQIDAKLAEHAGVIDRSHPFCQHQSAMGVGLVHGLCDGGAHIPVLLRAADHGDAKFDDIGFNAGCRIEMMLLSFPKRWNNIAEAARSARQVASTLSMSQERRISFGDLLREEWC
jgi:hypothetical protein